MDGNNEMMFNNQIFNSGPTSVPAQVTNFSNSAPSVVYGQGSHQELLDAIHSENPTKLVELLKSLPNPDAYINATEPVFKQSMFYRVVNGVNEKSVVDIAKMLVQFGGKINVKDIHGQSPLFYICKDGKIELLRVFLASGADINETDNFRQTPLFYASRDGRHDMVRFMIENRANPNHKDKVDETALFYAARDNRLETCKTLIQLGADVNIADQKKQTALFFAKKNHHIDIEELLIMNGAYNTKDGLLRQADLRKKPTPIQVMKSIAQISESSFQKDRKSLDVSRKKSSKAVNEEPKYAYRLQFTDEKMVSTDLSEVDFEQFKSQYPHLAKVLANPELMSTNSVLAAKSTQENWQSAAQQLLLAVWKVKEASIFHTPVDVLKLGIPDYLDIIKKPMDFGTIKKKLSLNVYPTVHDFITDMDLVFENCRLYNGTEAHVGQMGVRVKNEYLNFLKTFKLVERFGESKENKFVIDESCFDPKNNANELYMEEISDSEIPKDMVRQMNEKNEMEIESNPNYTDSLQNLPNQ